MASDIPRVVRAPRRMCPGAALWHRSSRTAPAADAHQGLWRSSRLVSGANQRLGGQGRPERSSLRGALLLVARDGTGPSDIHSVRCFDSPDDHPSVHVDQLGPLEIDTGPWPPGRWRRVAIRTKAVRGATQAASSGSAPPVPLVLVRVPVCARLHRKRGPSTKGRDRVLYAAAAQVCARYSYTIYTEFSMPEPLGISSVEQTRLRGRPERRQWLVARGPILPTPIHQRGITLHLIDGKTKPGSTGPRAVAVSASSTPPRGPC